MTRTTIVAEEALLARLRAVARRDGVSLAEAIRQGMQWRVSRRPPATSPGRRGLLGRMVGTGAIVGDIESPVVDPSDWEATRS